MLLRRLELCGCIVVAIIAKEKTVDFTEKVCFDSCLHLCLSHFYQPISESANQRLCITANQTIVKANISIILIFLN